MALNLKLLQELSEAPGVSGREEVVREIIAREVTPLVDDVSTDAMGNLIAYKKASRGASKRLMISAHMDEIGFYVRFIDEQGFLRVHNVGGFDVRNLFARQVEVHLKGGEVLLGVLNPGVKPVHIAAPDERKKIPEMSEFIVDLGLAAEEVKAKVKVGDPVTLKQPFADMGRAVTGKALDDRVNCFVLIETLRALKDSAFELYAVFSVQEEVGVRGAKTAAHALEPDIGVALDTTLAVDVPGTPPEQRVTELGAGVALKIMDGWSISTRWLLDAFAELAEAREIAYQLELLPLGGTDAGAMQLSRGGVPCVTLSIPSRYVHTVTEMVAKSDVEAAIILLQAFIAEGRG